MEPIVSGVGVIDKAALVLMALEHSPCSLAELVEATGLSRATAHRLAVALEEHGLVRRDPDGRFALGVRLVALGRRAAEGLPLASAALPALRALRDMTGESVQLYVREGERRVCIAALESPHGLRTIVAMGASLPLEVGSAGRILRDGAARPDATSSSDSVVPTNSVDSVGRHVWVQSVGEREPGVASVSAGVFDESGEVVAAVSVSGPIERISKDPGRRYGTGVVAAARRIEQAAGLAAAAATGAP